jgi:uncharacterized protein YjbJ (UPF0337 family)
MRSAREDSIRADIDKIAGRVLKAFGRLTGDRSTTAKGKAVRGRGAARSAKAGFKWRAR